ncbi:Zn-dependent exopeptidase [Lichtheimia hyalospora FSU 10163]|nr:Zn-dependent exopeptidase [Lichtheimia hyalospora FSU 10163]
MEHLRYYTSDTHLAGTHGDQLQAEWTRNRFLKYGISNTTIETYYPLLNYPLERRVAIVSGPVELRYEAKLVEDVVDEDGSSKQGVSMPAFHGYSKNGTALAPIIYAHYGRIKDFHYLITQGVQVNGTIALIRSTASPSVGHSIHTAEIFGCVGVLTYPDPVDNGPINKNGYPVKSYPDGPWRSTSSVQRGSAQFTAMLAGDPTTPGWAATKDAPRNESSEVPNIPSLPISYKDALPLLKAVEYRGTCDNDDWQGGLNVITYCSGPSEGQVHLINIVENKYTPIWNVIGRIQGKEEADHAVILGDHRDAWVYGASDPSSGTATMLELVRTLGILLSKGWQPRRSIIIASWDAGSFGTVGSTEWVEDHKDWLAKEAVAYIDVGGVQGPHFFAEASPTLKQLIYQVTQSIVAPDTNGSQTVYDTWLKYTNGTQTTPLETPTVYYPMSSKSDVTAFLSHIGIASMHFGFRGDIGVRYSAYDSFHWMEKFGDPTFDYHATLTKIWGLLTLHLANDRILPMYPQDYYDQVKQYIDDLSFTTTMDTMAHEQIADLSHGPFHKPLKKLRKRSRKFEHKREELMRSLKPYTNRHDDQLPEDVLKHLIKANKRLMYFERGFASDEGIQGREWFKHVIYAPNLLSSTPAVQVLPAIWDAFESNDTDIIQQAVSMTCSNILDAASILKHDY